MQTKLCSEFSRLNFDFIRFISLEKKKMPHLGSGSASKTFIHSGKHIFTYALTNPAFE